MSKKTEKDTMLWALVCSAYSLERVRGRIPTDLEDIRKLLSLYPSRTVSSYFLRAAITFDPPRTLEAATALYEHYGVETTGLEKLYPAQKMQ